ncbi:agamous-like MADS-box protein AGL80 [Argentina anserina]|uniref:agamous-like MADS-box protein AGL80 n=1 Tax=Argentina anserina TaxID=57926 RepID=UPI00217694CB|nr:agamous-like MADS-box protein AGL80 [Potentilla anserina]
MTRKKVNLTYITNDSARKATFKKRKKGLMKKVSELTTLCDIDACAIVYSPYDSQPDVWPSPLGVHRVLAQFKTMPEMEQSKKMVNQESFLRQRINKAQEQLKKQKKDNREKDMTRVMFQSLTGKTLQGLTMSDLTDLGWVIDQYLKDIQLRVKNIKEEAVKTQNQAQGAQGVTAAADHRMAAMKNNGEGSSSNMAMKSGEEGGSLQHAAPDMQALDQVHNLEAMQLQMMQMATQKQQNTWFMDMLNAPPPPPPHPDHHQHMGFTGEEMLLHFADHNNSTMWPNPLPAGGFNFP